MIQRVICWSHQYDCIAINKFRFVRSQALANQAEKRQRNFDKVIDEWKQKVADLQADLDRSNADGRASAAEVYKLKTQIDETHENIEALRRENKNLSGTYHAVARTSTEVEKTSNITCLHVVV